MPCPREPEGPQGLGRRESDTRGIACQAARGRIPRALSAAGCERPQALVLLAAGRAAVEVRTQPGQGRVRVGARELEVDVTVELGEALVAADLRPGRAEEPVENGVS